MRQIIKFCVRAYNLFSGENYGIGVKKVACAVYTLVYRQKIDIIDYQKYTPRENLELLTCTKSNREKNKELQSIKREMNV